MEEKSSERFRAGDFPLKRAINGFFSYKKETNKKNGFSFIFHPNSLNWSTEAFLETKQ